MESKRKPGVWWGAPPASEESIHNLLKDSGLQLPDAYLDQLRISNGGEGDLAVTPGWVCFWPAEEVVEHNKGYEVADNVPGFFGFGSNGGGELLAFRVDEPRRWAVYMIPFIIMEAEGAVRIAEDFAKFREAVGYESPVEE